MENFDVLSYLFYMDLCPFDNDIISFGSMLLLSVDGKCENSFHLEVGFQ